MRARTCSRCNLHAEPLIHELLIAGLRRRLWRHESGHGRSRPFESRCQASLAVDHSAYVAGAIAAQRLAACAAESYCGNIVVSGAVHTNLLYVVTGTTGRSLTDGPIGALASTTRLSNWL